MFFKRGLNLIRPSFFFIIVFLLSVSPKGYSQTTSFIDNLITDAINQDLHKQKKWRQLLHYKSSLFSNSEKSQIVSQNFFLSSVGNTDAKSELEATIKAYYQTISQANTKEHPRCKYPARYMWLEQSLNFPESEEIECKEFNNWSSLSQIEDIDLIFVSGYFGNPASFFGHIILIVHTPILNKGNKLLDLNINFGADIPEGENPISYMVKGLTGGYKSTFSDQHYYTINHYYSERDLRDQWVYRLNLTDFEKKFFISHIWEVLGANFNYYFFDKNCAYFIADALQLVIDKPLLNYDLPWAFPITVFQNLNRSVGAQASLVKEVLYYPSRQSRFYEKYNDLSSKLKSLVLTIIENNYSFYNEDFRSLANSDRVSVLDALLDYHSYLVFKFKKEESLKKYKQNVVLERLKINLNSPNTIYEIPTAPHLGQFPGKFSLSILNHDVFGLGTEVNFRGAYYDHLSISPGRPPHSKLTILDSHISFYQNKTRLSTLTFFSLEKLGITQTGLPRDAGKTWNVDIALSRKNLRSYAADQLVVQGGFGQAYSNNSTFVFFAMLDGRFIANDILESYVSPRTSVIFSPKEWVSAQATLAVRPNSILQTYELRLGFSQSKDLRILFSRDVESEFKAGVSFYF